MNTSIHSLSSNRDPIKKLVRTIFIIWLLCCVYLVFTEWKLVAELAFNDNDDAMRFFQYREWIQQGNWYLEPIPQFNPEHGVIMHWSRLVDIPLTSIALFLSLFFDWDVAFLITNILVPLIYLLVFLLVITLLTHHFFGVEAAKIAILIPLVSPLSSRFIPGALDHHNLQFILLATFFLFLPLVKVKHFKKNAFLASLCMLLSLWIGLENIYTFVFILFLLTAWGFWIDLYYLDVCKRICFNAVITIPILLIINRPYTEFFDAKYDALSFPFFLCFISGLIFCHLIMYFSSFTKYKKVIFYIISGILVLLPVISMYPELLQGGYANYPTLLKTIWLDNVSEARSIFNYIYLDGLVYLAYIFSVVMAIISPYFFRGSHRIEYYLLYIVFIINLILALFWQIRMFSIVLVCAIPLQAYSCVKLRERTSLSIIKTLWLFLSFPTFILSIFLLLFNNDSNKSYDDEKYSVISLLKKNNIDNKKTLASIDLGASIIVGTRNSITSAPYHRNIQGNLDTFNFFLAEDEKNAEKILQKYKIDYVLIDENFFDVLNSQYSDSSMFYNLFKNKKIPEYLEYVDSNKFIKLYKYVGIKK